MESDEQKRNEIAEQRFVSGAEKIIDAQKQVRIKEKAKIFRGLFTAYEQYQNRSSAARRL